ncbi:MAG: GH92 family glycosyl hydrolase [Bacteroidales bacterium]|jgi:predicted alpha-1,2-mannosidase|nr:GH92 family glycosyl hydrolase [Bacteroidales bacterium]
MRKNKLNIHKLSITAGFIFLNLLLCKAQKPVEYVDPHIGTAHCRWFHFTPAAIPFGMAKVAPSTNAHYGNASGWEAVGYDTRDTSIEGFANFHEFQVGGVVIAPSEGRLQTHPGDMDNPDDGYRSRFDKEDEYATAGYYSVLLKDYGIKAELTATSRVGFHRYTFPESSGSHIIFDIGNRQGESGQVKDAQVALTADGRIEGYVITIPEYVKKYQEGAEVAMYFSAILDKTPAAWGTFNARDIHVGQKEAKGIGAGLYLTFQTKENESVTVKVGLSYTSIANARLNLKTEAENLNFDKAHQTAIATWNKYLGRIQIEGNNRDDKVKFYTGLYHALLGRGLASDVNGAYPMNNGDVGQIEPDAKGQPLHHHYNTDAIWGAFWNLTQLWTLVYPEYYSDWIQSQLLVYKDAGWLGDGIACSKYVSGVGTNFVSLAIAAAYNCGIRDFDVHTGYEAALKNEIGWQNRPEGAGKVDVRQFVERGYSPYVDRSRLGKSEGSEIGSQFGASHTLEYSFSSYAVAGMARQLGKENDYRRMILLSDGWKNLYDPETKFIRPKDENGKFLDNFKPSEPWLGFQEGNAWQYTFYVPHDVQGLIDTLGYDEFNNRLDNIFTESQKKVFGGGTVINAFSGLETLYNHGNQPSLHISWLFNYSGKPHLTQKWTRAICDEFYGTEPVHGYGYGQDEDQGQLGAWYVMAAIGLFDVKALTGENPQFGIGSPMFDKITIQLDPKYFKGKKLVIETKNNSKTNVYVQSAKWKGKPYDPAFIPFNEIVKGGKLELKMGNNPAKQSKIINKTLNPTSK